jgi:hypothetical protein
MGSRDGRHASRECLSAPPIGILLHCFLQDRNVGIGAPPFNKEIVVSGSGLREISLRREGPRHLQSRQRTNGRAQDNARVVEDLLEFGGCSLSVPCAEIRQTPDVHGKQSGFHPQIVGVCGFEELDRLIRIALRAAAPRIVGRNRYFTKVSSG